MLKEDNSSVKKNPPKSTGRGFKCDRCGKYKEGKNKCNCGHPIEFRPKHLKEAIDYMDNCKDIIEIVEGDKRREHIKVALPTRAGLALHLGIATSTLDSWGNYNKEFKNLLEKLKQKQEDTLIQRGLSGQYNPTIAKLILHKHGYSDKQEIEKTELSLHMQLVKIINEDEKKD